MTLGPIGPSAHVAEVFDLLADDSELAARTRSVIVGPHDGPDPRGRELMAMVDRRGLTGNVRVFARLPPTEVDGCARAADVFVNLRHPEDGAGLMSLMYQLPFGKPVLTYDHGSFAEVPDDAVAKVAIGDRAGLRRRLWELVDSAARRHEIGGAAKRFAEAHGARDYARRLLRFATHDAAPPTADPLVEQTARAVAERVAVVVGESLAGLGAQADSLGVDAVITEACTLLCPTPTEPAA